jgi:hypothetical protein
MATDIKVPEPSESRRKSFVKKKGRRALHAIFETWPYVLLGLLIGFGLLSLQEYLRGLHVS